MMEKTTNTEVKISKSAIRRGMIEFVVLFIISREKIYESEVPKELKLADLLIVEGEIYPLILRLESEKLLQLTQEESKSVPVKKFYTLTEKGIDKLSQLKITWKPLIKSIESLNR